MIGLGPLRPGPSGLYPSECRRAANSFLWRVINVIAAAIAAKVGQAEGDRTDWDSGSNEMTAGLNCEMPVEARLHHWCAAQEIGGSSSLAETKGRPPPHCFSNTSTISTGEPSSNCRAPLSISGGSRPHTERIRLWLTQKSYRNRLTVSVEHFPSRLNVPNAAGIN
jgi:hypothetical protein